jgi:hypothetical protein
MLHGAGIAPHSGNEAEKVKNGRKSVLEGGDHGYDPFGVWWGWFSG